jgi:pilus assembly protein FimV
METPTLENPINEPTVESPTLDTLGANADTSEMPVLEDPTGLEVDLSGLADLPIDSDDISATGMHESLGDSGKPIFGDDQSRLSPETENIRVGDEDETVLASLEDLGKIAGDTHESGFGDTAATGTVEQPQFDNLSAGDTAEQPGFDTDLADTPGATMTEVGTKLDLARAYIDMGDPDGARSILKEVLDEGGDSQQQEARQLLEELSD